MLDCSTLECTSDCWTVFRVESDDWWTIGTLVCLSSEDCCWLARSFASNSDSCALEAAAFPGPWFAAYSVPWSCED